MVEIRPSGFAAGAEVVGVDLAQTVDDDTFAQISEAFDTYGVLCFRNQDITVDQHVAFSSRIGELEINYNAHLYGIDGSPEIYIISNITEDGRPIGSRRAGDNWHSDMIYAEKPARATMLYAVEVPILDGMTLGGTQFANSAAAYDALPDTMKQKITPLKGVFDFSQRKRSVPPKPEVAARYPPVAHPLVRSHPNTGRKSLNVMRDDCTGIADMAQEEADRLIEALADHIVRPEFVYQHNWQKGDFVMWDNCTVQHRAILDYDLPQRRLMWRTTVKGERPV
ncbi:MAG: TauD/TfdA family dioxygenase [Pseudomonadota bacterium]